MLIDARQQFEKEPKAFNFKRNRMTDAHRAWVEERYFDGWAKDYSDEQEKVFRREDFTYHKVKVVFWQADENDKPAVITEPYEKSFTTANVVKEQSFYCREPLTPALSPGERENRRQSVGESSVFENVVRWPSLSPLPEGEGQGEGKRDSRMPAAFIEFAARVKAGGNEKTVELALTAKDNAAKKFKTAFAAADEILAVEGTHRHYVADYEYIPLGEDIEAFLKREIAKPIIRREDSPQLGYEILPNKYFYRYQPPTPAKELLAEFWKLEKEAEKLLEGLANK